MKKSLPQIRIDKERFQVFIGGKEIVLSTVLFDLFVMICEADGKVVSRDNMIKRVWRCNPSLRIQHRTIDQHILRLRKLIGRDRPIIRTVRDRGYSLIRY